MRYLVDDLNPTSYLQVLEEVADGVVQTRYVYGTSVVSQTRNVSSTPATGYYGYDAHGNITFLTDTSGSVTDSYDYDAWGVLVASAGPTPNTRLYAGEEFDFDLGTVNLRARQYSSNTGRFLTIDPLDSFPSLGFVGPDNDPSESAFVRALRGLYPVGQRSPRARLQRYLYVKGDPVNMRDPSGLIEGISEGTFAGGITGALIKEVVITTSKGVLIGAAAAVAAMAIKASICYALWEEDRQACWQSCVGYHPGMLATCYASAADRYGNCLANRPPGPLATCDRQAWE
jgi:RHS repeat-associated protein